jgi:hypothetical protein
VAVSPRGQVTPESRSRVDLPQGDPTAGLADVLWEIVFSDYKPADGLHWPHRMVTSAAGRKIEDLRLGKFKINPKIDPSVFKPRSQR